MKRNIVLVLVLMATNIPISCDKHVCDEFTPLKSRVSELSSSIGSMTSSGFSSSKSTDFNQSAIQIEISEIDFSEISESTINIGFSFINSAYACSILEPEPTQTIESIIVTAETSVFSQGKEYLPGESLIELFKVAGYNYSNDEITVDQFIERQKSDFSIFGYVGEYIVFQLQGQPDISINQPLTFELNFSDSEKINIQTPTFEVS